MKFYALKYEPLYSAVILFFIFILYNNQPNFLKGILISSFSIVINLLWSLDKEHVRETCCWEIPWSFLSRSSYATVSGTNMESCKLKVLETERIKDLVLCFCHNPQKSWGDLSLSSTEIQSMSRQWKIAKYVLK